MDKNIVEMISSLILPTFVDGKEVEAKQLNSFIDIFRSSTEVLRDRIDYMRNYTDAGDYPASGNITDINGVSYKLLETLRDTKKHGEELETGFNNYQTSMANTIGDKTNLYNNNYDLIGALNNLNTRLNNNASALISLNNFLDGITVGVIEDLKTDIDGLQHNYASKLHLQDQLAPLKGLGYTNQTIYGNHIAINNLSIDVANAVTLVENKADLVNGVVPMDQIPNGLRSSNKGRYKSKEELLIAWPAGSDNLHSGDFAVIGTQGHSEFYSYSETNLAWESSGSSGTVNQVNTIDPDNEGNVTITTTEVTEGTNLYHTDARVTNNASVLANTAKRTYPELDEIKLSSIESSATLGADWLTNLTNIPNDLVYDADLTNLLANNISTVGKTGQYSDLIGKPIIPTLVSQLTNDEGYVKSITLDGYYNQTEVNNLLTNKVDKVTGKGLSEQNFTTFLLGKLDGIEEGAQVNHADTTIQGNTFNTGNKLVKLNTDGKLPALDASNLTNINLGLPLSLKGDLLVHTGTALDKLSSGATGQILSVDPTDPTGLKWIDNQANLNPTTFLGLSDTPSSYSTKGRHIPMVSEDESGLELLKLEEPITGSFTNENLVGNTLTIPHTQGDVILPYVITDEANNYMIPNSINYSNNQITVSLADFTPITGTWHYAFGSRSIDDPDNISKVFKVNSVYSNSLGEITLVPGDIGAMTATTFIPSTTNDLTNNSGYITNAVSNLLNYTKSTDISSVGKTGAYDDLLNKPTIPTALSELSTDASNRTVTDTEKALWNGFESTIDTKLALTASGKVVAPGGYHIPDIRGESRAPNYYRGRAFGMYFMHKHDSDAGGDMWTGLFNVFPWDTYNSTHRQQQLAFTGTGGLKFRYAKSDTTWDSWQKVLTDKEALSKTNSDIYEPTAEYHPATKKYVDDNKAELSYALNIRPTSLDESVKDIRTLTKAEYDALSELEKESGLFITTDEDDTMSNLITQDETSPKSVSKMWVGTQAQYDAVVHKDPNTLYLIEE